MSTPIQMRPRSPDDPKAVEGLVRQFENGTLALPSWTHEAHLAVCWHVLRRMPPEEALAYLRQAIRRFNSAVGTINSDTGGYHETLTRYYVEAVFAVEASDVVTLFTHPWCMRSAPRSHWSPERLWSVQARRNWLEPDRTPLPWLCA